MDLVINVKFALRILISISLTTVTVHECFTYICTLYRLDGSPNIFTCCNFEIQRYLGKYDSLSFQDKLSLVDDLNKYHISGLKRGIKSLDCFYIENNVPYSRFILQGFKLILRIANFATFNFARKLSLQVFRISCIFMVNIW